MSDNPKRMDQETTKSAGLFLFKMPFEDSKGNDMRTVIKSDKMMRSLMYYAMMGEIFEASNATTIKDAMERMLMATDGLRASQAVEVLKQNFPKRVEIDKGDDGTFAE